MSSTFTNVSLEGTGTFEPQQQSQSTATKPNQPVRIILLVEATAAAATNSKTARKWIDVLLKKLDADARGVEPSTSAASSGHTKADDAAPRIQYGLVVYGTTDRSTQAPIQFSSWTSSLVELFEWLNGVQFVGGSNSKGTALTQALAQAIMMSKCPYPDGTRPPAAGIVCGADLATPVCVSSLVLPMQCAVLPTVVCAVVLALQVWHTPSCMGQHGHTQNVHQTTPQCAASRP